MVLAVRKNHRSKFRDEELHFLYEFLAVFGNGTTAEELASCLGRRRETVQRAIIAGYQRHFPGVLEYDSRTRKTVLSRGAALKFCPTAPSAIAALAHADQIKANFEIDRSVFAIPVEDIGIVSDLFQEHDYDVLEADPFRCLFAALMRKQAVHLDYFAKTGRSSFSFSPHALVRTSFRLHFRGFSDTQDGRPGHYIDVIAERVARAEFLGSEVYTGPEGDADWKKKVRIMAELRNDLPLCLHHPHRSLGALHEGPAGHRARAEGEGRFAQGD
jgi:hypothetical protein